MPTYRPVGLDYFAEAPCRWDASVELECTPERLFEVFEDADAWPRWLGLLRRVEWTSERPYGPGTTRRVFLRGGGWADEHFFVWDAGRRICFYFTAGTVPARAFAEDYRVTDLGRGRSRLDWTMAMTPPRGLGIAVRMGGPLARAMNRHFLSRLARQVREG